MRVNGQMGGNIESPPHGDSKNLSNAMFIFLYWSAIFIFHDIGFHKLHKGHHFDITRKKKIVRLAI